MSSSLENIRTYINDPEGVTYPDAHLFDAMNEALLDLHVDSKTILATATWTATTSADLIATPPTLMVPQSVIYDGKPYFFSTQAELERWSSNWRGTPLGQPRWFVRWSADYIRVWPRPDQTYVFKVIGVGWPTQLTPAASTVMSDANWRQAIEHKTAATLLTLARPDLAKIHYDEYEKARNSYNVEVRNHQSHRMRTLRPGTKYNNAQTGSIVTGRWFK